jgi:hypothetical protein
MVIQEWSSTTGNALLGFWNSLEVYTWKVIGALIVFILGWIVAVWVGKIIAAVLKAIKLDAVFEKTKWQEALDKADIKGSVSGFIGKIVTWVLTLVVLLASVQILIPQSLGDSLVAVKTKLVNFLPDLVIAIAIFVVAVIVSELAEKIAKAIVGKMDIKHISVVGMIIRYAIWILAGFMILEQLHVAPGVVDMLMTGLVALLVLSGSLAFGLGGKEVAKDILEGLRRKLKD